MAVTPPQDRDAALDRILQRFAIPAEPAVEETVVSEDCLDAETVAAMADGGLSADEQAAVAEHALGCPRCREIIAAVIRTTPEPPPRRVWWQMLPIRWLAPAVATGLAVVVWVAVANRYPSVTTTPTTVMAPARREQPVAPAPAPAPAQNPAQSNEKRASSAVQPSQRDLKESAALQDAAKDAVALGGRALKSSAADERRTARQEQRLKAAEPLDQLAAAKPRVDQPAAAKQKEEVLEKKADILAPVPSLTAAAAAPAAPATAPPATPVGASSVAGGAVGGVGGRGARKAAPETPRQTEAFADRAAASPVAEAVSVTVPEITSPDPRSRWRISGTSMERSTDGGETWTPQAVPIAVHLMSGSSPTTDVCWVVGDQGTIMMSVDGRSWQLLNAPDSAMLVSVRATSADAATVTTRDGRTFATTNRGRTWVKQ